VRATRGVRLVSMMAFLGILLVGIGGCTQEGASELGVSVSIIRPNLIRAQVVLIDSVCRCVRNAAFEFSADALLQFCER